MSFTPTFNLINELRWRGLLHDMLPETEQLLQRELVSGYVGFDPTADSLHVGNLVPVMLLRLLQQAGHRPIVLVGGATGLVGDPSGKSSERNLLDKEQLAHNQLAIKNQLQKFLDFSDSPNAAEMVNNFDWFQQLSFLDFIRDVGKHISVNYMMAKDSVKNRMETGISFTEFSYQLIQGYDFAHLYKHKNCKLQMGGSDQWGNITTGTELVRRMHGGEAFALTAPLLTKSDGTKFGKSEGGNVWLDPEKTSPYAFYQFWLNVSDDDAEKLIKVFGSFTESETMAHIKQHLEAPHARHLQKLLAQEVTTLVHSKEAYEMAVTTSSILFGNPSLTEIVSVGKINFLQAMDGVPRFTIDAQKLAAGIPLLDLLAVDSAVCSSKGEARKMVQSNAVSLNKSKTANPETVVDHSALLFDSFILVQKGKKNYYLLEI